MNEANTIGLPLDTTVLIGIVLATKWSVWDQFPSLSLLVIINLKQKLTDVCVCLYLPRVCNTRHECGGTRGEPALLCQCHCGADRGIHGGGHPQVGGETER